MTLPDSHLDLGCGKFPRNPYGRGQLHGIDIRPLSSDAGFEYRSANLAVQAIPYSDDAFGSVSAFDFIEHVPRVLPTPDGRDTHFPFIRLMDEVWRVLAPGGRFYALTPAYPNPDAFTDPTHVNIITDQTHEYFCGESPLAQIYGFKGRFDVVRCEWVDIKDCYDARQPARRRPLSKRAAAGLRNFLRRLRGVTASASGHVYLLWELQAIKPPKP